MLQNQSNRSLKSCLLANISTHFSQCFLGYMDSFQCFWSQFIDLIWNEKVQKWQVMKNVSIIMSCFLLRDWARIVFDIQLGNTKVLKLLKCIRCAKICFKYNSTYTFLTFWIFWALFLAGQTSTTLVSKMLWLQLWVVVALKF